MKCAACLLLGFHVDAITIVHGDAVCRRHLIAPPTSKETTPPDGL